MTPTDPTATATAPLSETVSCYSPAHAYATIAVQPHEVELGDVVDHTDGLVVVTEITRRRATWTLGGYNPALPARVPHPVHGFPNPVDRPLLTRDVRAQPRIRVRRPAAAWARLPGHTKKVTSRNPIRSGCYTLIDGYDVACSCGWSAAEPARSKYSANEAVLRHRAEAIADQTHQQTGLRDIERVEAELGDVLPWRWDHGAQANLRGLTTTQAVARLTPWAVALGVEIEHMAAGHDGLRSPYFLWVDSRPARAEGRPGLDIRAYPVDGPPCG
ncbi:hypothetical protein RVR_10592 [Actinacidiphila reveromycinica]|uniref:Uncharacterized protein n=1 Tax=Actinacidiphila reveromycinica TaxID=659352 RepID=A0A7U3UXF2_9ACTN|nr:hypothetical protein [Streptomyces sp. SN-593]BBB00593.1 hypothetical protein RVR_7728 [Streptomyces sp. SN-593]BBB00646.1 hypothetical protein RVR_10592 [Streptomyces sp. SN-593]